MSDIAGVVNDPISANGDKEYVDGAYDTAATMDDEGLKGQDLKINAPDGNVGEESIKGNQISRRKFNAVKVNGTQDRGDFGRGCR